MFYSCFFKDTCCCTLLWRWDGCGCCSSFISQSRECGRWSCRSWCFCDANIITVVKNICQRGIPWCECCGILKTNHSSFSNRIITLGNIFFFPLGVYLVLVMQKLILAFLLQCSLVLLHLKQQNEYHMTTKFTIFLFLTWRSLHTDLIKHKYAVITQSSHALRTFLLIYLAFHEKKGR